MADDDVMIGSIETESWQVFVQRAPNGTVLVDIDRKDWVAGDEPIIVAINDAVLHNTELKGA